MRSLFRFLRAKRFSYEPLVTVEISRAALEHNLETYTKHISPCGVAPVLKANAYGHGLVEVARIVDGREGVRFLVVDSYYEVLQLRNEGIRSPILVIGYTLSENILKNTMHDVAFCISSLSQLRALSKADVSVALHLKFDTGMHRQGMMPDELPEAADIVRTHSHLHVAGICSHLADADGDDGVYTERQIEVWNGIVEKWRTQFPDTSFFHLSATAGARFAKKIDANVGRLGIGLYGISDVISDAVPALSVKTIVTSVRSIHAGDSVGYNNTWTAMRQTHVATIPVGYYEGVDRRLSSAGFVRIGGLECPIIGRVSMNMTTVDVTDVPSVKEGDTVEVISTESHALNSVARIAELCGTIPYDILVHIPTTLRRVVV